VKRRIFIAGLGSAAAWPVVAWGQQPAVPVIGYLGTQSADDDSKFFTVPFLQGLKETGYVEGENVAIEYLWAENQNDRLPALAADLVRHRVAIIIAEGATAARAAKAATTTIPIVFETGGDPVALDSILRNVKLEDSNNEVASATMKPPTMKSLRQAAASKSTIFWMALSAR
jgi:putative ABC transport system substrate-binding protein